MGTLMKDVPATRYSLLNRTTPELRKAELIRNFQEDVRRPTRPMHPGPSSLTIGSRQYRSTEEELHAYVKSAYRR